MRLPHFTNEKASLYGDVWLYTICKNCYYVVENHHIVICPKCGENKIHFNDYILEDIENYNQKHIKKIRKIKIKKNFNG